MPRFAGTIGISKLTYTSSPGIVKRDIHEVDVVGEIRNQRFSWSNANMRDGLRMQHVLSIVTPEDSDIDFSEVVYVNYRNHKWAVTAIEYKRPRVELTMGGAYNG